MIYKVEFLGRARKELLEAWEFYEERRVGLGDKFKIAVDRKIQLIEGNPERYKEKIRGFRETKIEIFPYHIIYRIHKSKRIVAISSIFHTSRNPKGKYSSRK